MTQESITAEVRISGKILLVGGIAENDVNKHQHSSTNETEINLRKKI
jgi:hypothetical protein